MTVANPPTPLAPTAAVAARAYRTGALSTVNGSVKIPIDTLSYDTASSLQLGSGRWVCPIAGNYQVDGQVTATSSAANQWLLAALYQNGSPVSFGSVVVGAATSLPFGSSVSDVLRCAQGDIMELWVSANAVLVLTVAVAQQNWLSVKG